MNKPAVNLFLPGFYENFRLILFLHDWMEREPEYRALVQKKLEELA